MSNGNGYVAHIVAIVRFTTNVAGDYKTYIKRIIGGSPKLYDMEEDSTIQFEIFKDTQFNDDEGDIYIIVTHGDVRGITKKDLRKRYDAFLNHLSNAYGGGVYILNKASTITDNDRSESRH